MRRILTLTFLVASIAVASGPSAFQAVSARTATGMSTSATADGPIVVDALFEGGPTYYRSMGDLWMATWADDDRVYLTWGDGTGVAAGYPTGHPGYENTDSVDVTFCPDDTYTAEDAGYFPCWLWSNVYTSGSGETHPTSALTDAGVLAFTGAVPPAESALENVAIDIPDQEPFFVQEQPSDPIDISGRNDKPSSLLSIGSRLYLAGHSPAGLPVLGYIAYSDDGGRTWTEVPDSPWGEESNFRVLMLANMGQGYGLNQDGYVYGYGVGTEASWSAATVYLARVPVDRITEYDAYEYFTGASGGEPGWSSVEADAVAVEGLHTTGQASAMYHEGTGRYLFLTTDAGPPDHLGALYEAPQPWGPWTAAGDLCFDLGCRDTADDPAWADGKYIAGLLPKGAGPNHVYITVSGGDEHYQLQIGKLLLGLAGCPTGHVPEDGFSDVPEDAVHEDAIDCLAWWAVTSGTGDGGYAPGVTVSRAQMARFVANLLTTLGIELDTTQDLFTDDDGSPHEDAINGLAAAGIVSGTGEGRYSPGRLVTRAQMTKFLVNAYEYASGRTLPAGPDRFTDDEGSIMEELINTAAEAGFAQGTSETTFAPGDPVTRAQMASFLVRVLDRITREGLALPPL